MITIHPYNETYIKVECEDFGVEQELSEFFTFFADGYRFQPKFKAKIWDGKIRLFDMRRKVIYKGLLNLVVEFCKTRDIKVNVDVSLKNTQDITDEEIKEFVDSLTLTARGKSLEIRDYQYEAITHIVRNKRSLAISPTSSGKSLILYSKIRWHLQHGHKVLLVVPTTILVEQMYKDFEDYSTDNGWSTEDNVQTLFSGKERVFSRNVMISTWQSLAAMMKNDVEKFKAIVERTDVLLMDEAHTYKASVVLSTMEKFTNSTYRTGTTGTLDDSKINKLSLVGLIGPIFQVTTTKQLMDAGQVSDLNIKCLILKYPDEIKKAFKNMTYQEEIDFLVASNPRNNFIANLATATKGNTLILFNFVERHGSVLNELIKNKVGENRNVYFIHGGVDVEERENIRTILQDQNNAIIIATASLFSTGVNIPSIENVIFAIPTKSSIRIRQSIGRGLRLNDGKTSCTVFDLADDLSSGKFMNNTLRHFEDRLKIYAKDQFNVKIIQHTLSY